MSKVSLKEQIEKVENQSLSGIYSKEDVLALLNDVNEDVAPDGGIPKSGLTETEVQEIVEHVIDHLESEVNGIYNANDYLENPQFEFSYGTEVVIDSVDFDGQALVKDIADNENLFKVIQEALTSIADQNAVEASVKLNLGTDFIPPLEDKEEEGDECAPTHDGVSV
jgi:hypothetical protein